MDRKQILSQQNFPHTFYQDFNKKVDEVYTENINPKLIGTKVGVGMWKSNLSLFNKFKIPEYFTELE
jgi:hypothetical protein